MLAEVVDEEVNFHRNHALFVISSYFPAYAFCFVILLISQVPSTIKEEVENKRNENIKSSINDFISFDKQYCSFC